MRRTLVVGAVCAAALTLAVACGDDEGGAGGAAPGGSGAATSTGTGGGAGDGGAGGTGGSGITVGELASRTGGVAPLAVFFDAVNTPGVVQPAEVDGRREYADLHYEWDFGDSGAGMWPVSGRSRNRATGYVAAHVYETPGSYAARLTVTTTGGATESYQVDITVDDPDATYAGAATVCMSTSSDFAGCPAGADQVTTTTLDDLESHIGASKRILLRRGDTWSSAGSITVSSTGPTTIGAFGDCTAPDERGICQNAPVLQATGTDESSLFSLHNATDLRMMDLHAEGPAERSAIGGATGIDAVLVLRFRTLGMGVPLGASHWETDGHDQFMFVDCDAGQSDTNVVYVGSERLALLGNRFRDPSQSHVVRVWQAHKGVISHNDISGSSVNSDAGRHALKFHGPDEDQLGPPDGSNLARRSRFVVISNNLFGGSGPWPVAIGPQDSSHDERLEDLLVEQNRFYPGYGTQSCCSSAVQVSLHIWARHVTVRNNLFSGEGSATGFTAISVGPRGIEPPPLGTRIYHNTIYKSDPQGSWTEATGIRLDDAAVDTTLRNNLVHFATGFDAVAMIDGAGTNLVEDHNLMTDSPGLVDPDNADFLAKDFSLQAGSPAIDSGTDVPVFDDFLGSPRPNGAAYDLGAFER